VAEEKIEFTYDLTKSVDWSFVFMKEEVQEKAMPIMERFAWAHQIAHKKGISQVSWHKLRLGRQGTCQNLGSERRRFWVWQVAPEAIILISNHKGICFEVQMGTPVTRVVEIARQYFTDIGLDEGVSGI
jgi:hypothetical protein